MAQSSTNATEVVLPNSSSTPALTTGDTAVSLPTPVTDTTACAAENDLSQQKQSQSQGKSNRQKKKQKQKKKQRGPQPTATPTRPAFGPDTPFVYDIGANLCDDMFKGEYNGKSYHEADLPLVLARAAEARVGGILCTAGSLTEAQEAVSLVQAQRLNPAIVQSGMKLFSTVGVHPTRCGEFEEFDGGPDAYYAQLKAVATEAMKQRAVIAIGG